MPRVLYSDNDTGTFADALKAVGLAEVAATWLKQVGLPAEPITIEDKGGYYQITLPAVLDESAVEAVTHPFAVGRGKLLVGKKQEARAGTSSMENVFAYDEERAKAETYFAQRNKLSDADRRRFNEGAAEFEELRRQAPHPDLGLYVYVNHFKVADGYNALLEQWRGQGIEAFRTNLWLILTAFARNPNDIAGVAAQWEALAKEGKVSGKAYPTLLQLINPASGKGGNAPKASSLGIGNLDGFWLLEYLKFVGLFTITAPYIVSQSKDRKTYVLRPVRVELGVLRAVMEQFRQRLYATTAIKLDILVALRFTIRLLEYLRDAHQARGERDPLLALFGKAPRVTDIAQGFDVAFYKDMGSAYATMNMATVNLPAWLAAVTSPAVATGAIGLLSEHERVVSGIRSAKGDEGSEEIELLRRYRDFLSGRDASRFFDCAARYGDYYLAKRHRGQWADQFTTDGMETLMAQSQGQQGFSRIIANEGFQAVAGAIRRATVIAQYYAARESGYPYEVRYGLGQELLRAANYPEAFLAALSEFVQSYNAENARIDERIAKRSLSDNRRTRRASVRTDHINEIVQLIDDFRGNSELICKMLVAYGYARDPRAEEAPAAMGAGGAA